MRTSPFFLHHITRPCTIKQGNVSELVLQLRRIHNHQNIFPAPQKPTSVEINLGSLNSHPLKNNQKKLEQTPEYKKLVSEALKRSTNRIHKARMEKSLSYSPVIYGEWRYFFLCSTVSE
ncbi:hypothetical protein M0K80_RS10685 [Providencia rettgeri]|nr:hypothetical protein [Providencia rettgeri]